MNGHLKQHVMFYLGLAQLIAGYAAATCSGPWIKYALEASGLVTVIVKYVKDNLPDDDAAPSPTPAPAPAPPEPPAHPQELHP